MKLSIENEKAAFSNSIMRLKHADGMANNEDPDQTFELSLRSFLRINRSNFQNSCGSLLTSIQFHAG